MTQAWYQQKFLDRRLDIKLGRFGEGEDFNSFVCDFQNLTFCGSQVGNWGPSGTTGRSSSGGYGSSTT